MNVRLLISLDLELRKKVINKILANHQLSKNHPDVLYFDDQEKLGIDQAKKIKAHFALKPYSAKGRALVIEEAGNLTLDAQNGLLKLLEEPPYQAILLLAAKSEHELLPTILSRCEIENLESRVKSQEDGKRFFADIERLRMQSIEERFEYVNKLEEKEQFLIALVYYFRQRLHQDLSLVNFTKQLIEVQAWDTQNVNIRAILEYLMLKLV